jgi:hypothetical protein
MELQAILKDIPVIGVLILGTSAGAYCGYKGTNKLIQLFQDCMKGNNKLDEDAKIRQAHFRGGCSAIGGALGCIGGFTAATTSILGIAAMTAFVKSRW